MLSVMDDKEFAEILQADEFSLISELSPPSAQGSRKTGNKKCASSSASLVDPSWELIDPNPNIHTLFQVFDKKYFWSSLGSVEVKWSSRMYSCAGICTYKGKRGGCVVSLSLPLLKLRPRKDLIETLLHEMIHAYLFITANDRDRDGHGPQFHHHMYRINAEAGTKISVYHSFHDEVHHYRTHWWRCDGPCRTRHPFYGIVKRAMNRAPGPNDFWFPAHQSNCGGTFVKIQEPEGYASKKRKTDSNRVTNPALSKENRVGSLFDAQSKSPSSRPSPLFNSSPTDGHLKTPSSSKLNEISRPANNIHGFKASNMEGTVKTGCLTDRNTKTVVPFSGKGYTLGSRGTIVDYFGSKQNPADSKKLNSTSTAEKQVSKNSSICTEPKRQVRCPSCDVLVNEDSVNEHLDSCLEMECHDTSTIGDHPSSPSLPPFVDCPVCCKRLCKTQIDDHLSDCLRSDPVIDLTEDGPTTSMTSPSVHSCKTDFAHCSVCGNKVLKTKMGEHLEGCVRLDSIMDSSGFEIADISGVEDHGQSTSEVKCPCCDKSFPADVINSHLDSCLQSLDFY